jgi:SAM-dependent methyltransferase
MSLAQPAAPRELAVGYMHTAAAFEDELARLRLLEERYDARTFARLSALGPLAGTRCLEIAAGAGSVARWLAAQAGPAGRVVATDADRRFLASTAAAGVEVRRHDILAGHLEPRRYDLVHCRALLCHLADPRRALRNMAAAVRPGGWLLAEDADYVSLVAADPAHPRSARFDAVMGKLLAFLAAARSFDPFFGRRLPPLLAAMGFAEAGSEAVACHRQGGGPAADLLRRSLQRISQDALRRGVVDAGELAAVLAALRDPSFGFVDALSVAAWGRGPGSAPNPPSARGDVRGVADALLRDATGRLRRSGRLPTGHGLRAALRKRPSGKPTRQRVLNPC